MIVRLSALVLRPLIRRRLRTKRSPPKTSLSLSATSLPIPAFRICLPDTVFRCLLLPFKSFSERNQKEYH